MYGAPAMAGPTLTTVLLLLAGDLSAVQAQTWQVSQGRVGVVCPLTVGGRFEAKTAAVTGRVTFTEGSRDITGAFVVDVRTLETGIRLRDVHLRDNYLEVSRGSGY